MAKKPRANKFVEQPEDIQDAFTPIAKGKKQLSKKLDSLIKRAKDKEE